MDGDTLTEAGRVGVWLQCSAMRLRCSPKQHMTRNYNNKKLRAVFLAALMFLWVFAGTVAFAGGAAANPQSLSAPVFNH